MIARRKKAKKRKTKTTLHTIQINLNREHLGYVQEIAEYACVTVDVVCAVMMACGIFQAKRYRPPQKAPEAPPAPPAEPAPAEPVVTP